MDRFITSTLLLLTFFALLSSCATESTPVYSLTVISEPIDAGTVSSTQMEAEEGETITITATPNEHWKFHQWSGDFSGNTNPAEIMMDRDKEVTALFLLQEYPLIVHIVGEGEVIQEVISSKTTEDEYEFETLVKLTAEPNFGWKFSGWSGDVEDNSSEIEVKVDGPLEVTATFTRADFTLDLTVIGEGKIEQEVVQPRSLEYEYETVLKLTAIPDTGWIFSSWGGDAEGDNPEVIIEMDGNKDISATFERILYPLTVEIDGEGRVDQRVLQAKSTDYPFQTIVQLSTVPSSGWEFYRWNGDLDGNERVKTIEIDAEKTVGATFLEIPSIETLEVTTISATTATGNARVNNQSNVTILQKGICWSTSPDTNPLTNPDLNCELFEDLEQNSFSVEMEGLTPSTLYYVRGAMQYIIRSEQLALGNEIQFTTSEAPSEPPPPDDDGDNGDDPPPPPPDDEDPPVLSLPTVSTISVDPESITTTSAVTGGSVTDDGGAAVTARGVCFNNSPNPDFQNNISCISQGSGTGSFSTTLSGLIAANSYWLRAYATNSEGTAFGNQVSFTTLAEGSPPPPPDDDGDNGDDPPPPPPDDEDPPVLSLPTVSTISVDPESITTTSAVTGGSVTDDGGAAVTARGVCFNNSPNPDFQNNISCISQGSGTGSFSTTLSGLIAANSYWVRAYATNSEGTAFGNQVSFTTLAEGSPPPPPDDDGDNGDDPPPPGDGTTQLTIMFSEVTLANSGTPTGALDVNVNGTWYNFSTSYAPQVSLPIVGTGVVLNIPGPVTYLALRQSQIRKPGLNNDCYGFTSLKMMKKEPGFVVNANNWGLTYQGDGNLVERGSQNYMIDTHSDPQLVSYNPPTFYAQNLPVSWTDSGSFMLWVDGVGENHGGYTNANSLLGGAPGLFPSGRTTALPVCTDL